MKTGKIIAVAVTYNPDIELLERSIASYAEAVDRIIIADNSTSRWDFTRLIKAAKITVIDMDGNRGIAHALNAGVEVALNDGADYVLTMDQDTIFTPPLKSFPTFLFAPDVMAIAPYSGSPMDTSTRQIDKAMQSGVLFSAEALRRIGKFNEKYFIDYVDYEYFKRGKAIGYRMIEVRDLTMHHRNGEIFHGKFFGRKYSYKFSVPIRMYYQTRNALDYIGRFHDWWEVVVLTVLIAKVILIADRKPERLKLIAQGFADRLRGRWGGYHSIH